MGRHSELRFLTQGQRIWMPLASFFSNCFFKLLSFQHTAQYNVSDIGLVFLYNTQAQGITAYFWFVFHFLFHIPLPCF
ncbi:hypothetical protein QBC42DRAFT_276819 [Cladorrhinum samala]|uniref:Uncharacterized protein n=1 Tax=Cladorrhinum samala TaxID=585594 RepID=A0AAV9HH83_9PEZI|nr:hypothetical protein QBC42DRAFT_276819 [Cladorrhinum samala]